MNWFLLAFAAPFVWAIVNIFDNFLVAKYSEKDKERSSGGLVLFSSLIGIFIAVIIGILTKNIFSVSIIDKLLLISTGGLSIAWIILYLYALEIEEVSVIVPWFSLVPVFGYILGYTFLSESLTTRQILGSAITLLGVVLVSIDFWGIKKSIKKRTISYIIFASLIIAISGVIFKYVTIGGSFWISSFWEYVGLGLTGIILYMLVPKYRHEFIYMNKTGGRKIFLVNIGSELLTILGNLMTNFAIILAPISLVYLVGSFQPAIVLVFTIIGTKFFPHIINENISKKVLVQKILAILITILGSILLFI